MSLVELQDLESIIERKINTCTRQERSALIEEMNSMAKDRGFLGLDELINAGGSHPKPKRKSVSPKYRNPANPDATWTGRERKPRWVVEMIDADGALEDALIKN